MYLSQPASEQGDEHLLLALRNRNDLPAGQWTVAYRKPEPAGTFVVFKISEPVYRSLRSVGFVVFLGISQYVLETWSRRRPCPRARATATPTYRSNRVHRCFPVPPLVLLDVPLDHPSC